MDISYAKDFKHNYLVIQDNRVLEDDYQLQMVTRNDVEGLLKCQERMINGKGLLYYEVTSKQNLKNLFDHRALGFDDIDNILGKIGKTCENLSHFLLYGSELILEPEYIYMDIDTKECSFVYYPFYESENESNLTPLLSFFMERHNTEDMKAVEAIYQLSDVVERQHLKISEALEWYKREYADTSVCETAVSIPPLVEERYENTVSVPAVCVPQKKKRSLFSVIKGWFMDKEDEDEFLFETPEYDFLAIEESMEKPAKDNDATVFIPWIENSEQKLYGVGRGNKYHIDLTQAPIILGKQEGNVDMVISDSSISRMHAKIIRSGSKYTLTDLNSTNGTFRNGLRLLPNETVSMEPGDEIGLGKLKFIYR